MESCQCTVGSQCRSRVPAGGGDQQPSYVQPPSMPLVSSSRTDWPVSPLQTQRSGVSRVPLNRNWPSKGALALDAYLYRSQDQLAFPDTGNITDDLVAVLSAWVGLLDDMSHRRAVTQLIGTAQSDGELAAALDEHYFGPHRKEALNMLAIDLPTGIAILWGACYHRLLLPNLRTTLTAPYVTGLVSTALSGIAADSRSPWPAASRNRVRPPATQSRTRTELQPTNYPLHQSQKRNDHENEE